MIGWLGIAPCYGQTPSDKPSDKGGQTAPSQAPAQDTPPPQPAAPVQEQTVPGANSDWTAGSALFGRGGLGGFGSADVGHMPIRADYRATWFPDEPVKGQGTDLGFVRQDLSVVFPLWQNAPDELSGSVHVRNELLHTGGTILPDTGQPLPDELWAIRLGTTYRHLFDNGWVAGGTISVGSASDKPFDTINEMDIGFNAFLRVPQGEHNAWLFSLSYSTNSELPIPIPGVAFLWQPAENFRANIGLPFQIMYRPIEDLTFDFSYMLLTNIHARTTYRLMPRLRIYAGYEFNNEAYLPADRLNENDRLFYYDQHVVTGVQYLVAKNATFEVSGGYAFDRYYFEGHSFTDRGNNRIDIGAGPFLSVDFRMRW
jgi:hypothetical protein